MRACLWRELVSGGNELWLRDRERDVEGLCEQMRICEARPFHCVLIVCPPGHGLVVAGNVMHGGSEYLGHLLGLHYYTKGQDAFADLTSPTQTVAVATSYLGAYGRPAYPTISSLFNTINDTTADVTDVEAARYSAAAWIREKLVHYS